MSSSARERKPRRVWEWIREEAISTRFDILGDEYREKWTQVLHNHCARKKSWHRGTKQSMCSPPDWCSCPVASRTGKGRGSWCAGNRKMPTRSLQDRALRCHVSFLGPVWKGEMAGTHKYLLSSGLSRGLPRAESLSKNFLELTGGGDGGGWCRTPAAPEVPRTSLLSSPFSVAPSQGCLFILPFLGLTEEETRNCIRIETRKRWGFVKKKKVEHRCTTNKLSEKYEGTVLSLWAYLGYPEPGSSLSTVMTVLFLTSHLFHFSTSEP